MRVPVSALPLIIRTLLSVILSFISERTEAPLRILKYFGFLTSEPDKEQEWLYHKSLWRINDQL